MCINVHSPILNLEMFILLMMLFNKILQLFCDFEKVCEPQIVAFTLSVRFMDQSSVVLYRGS